MTTNEPTSTKIENYDIVYSTNANAFVPRIVIKNDGKNIGQLYFQPDGSKLPADYFADGEVILYYHLEDFENVLDMLRNAHDTPVYLTYNNGNAKFENGILT
jgi:hypothetical protein